MRLEPITLSEIVNTNLFWENPNINFVSPIYDNDLKVIRNGIELDLEYATDYLSRIEIPKIGKIRRELLIKNIIGLLVVSIVTSLFGTVINIGPNFLPKEPGYWKYMILQFSILSAFLFGFVSLFEIIYSKKRWTKRCVLNGSVINPGKKKRCDFITAQRDVESIIESCYLPLSYKHYIPYGFDYFRIVNRMIGKLTPKTNLYFEYNRCIASISESNGLIKTVSSFVVGVCIEVFSFVDLFKELEVFRVNMILSAILVIIASIFIGYSFVSAKYNKAYIKMDSILYLYSYMYLDMPFNSESKNNCEIIKLDKEISIDYQSEQTERIVSEMNRYSSNHICLRQAIVKDDQLLLFGVKFKTK